MDLAIHCLKSTFFEQVLQVLSIYRDQTQNPQTIQDDLEAFRNVLWLGTE